MPSFEPRFDSSAWLMLSVLLAFLFYLFLVLDARRPGSTNADDDQLGAKAALGGILCLSALLALDGLSGVLHYLVTFDRADEIKGSLPPVLVGAAVGIGVWFKALPLTNANEYPKMLRMLVGSLALLGGLVGIISATAFLTELFTGKSWVSMSMNLMRGLVYGGFGGAALNYLLHMASSPSPGGAAEFRTVQPTKPVATGPRHDGLQRLDPAQRPDLGPRPASSRTDAGPRPESSARPEASQRLAPSARPEAEHAPTLDAPRQALEPLRPEIAATLDADPRILRNEHPAPAASAAPAEPTDPRRASRGGVLGGRGFNRGED